MADDTERSKTSGNPTLRPRVFEEAKGNGVMTIEGTVNKTGILLLLLSATASYVVYQAMFQQHTEIMGLAMPALIVALVLGLIISFVPKTAPYLAPVYAICEGLAIGVVSMIFEARFPGIVVQAAGLTLATLAAMLFGYKAGFLRATAGFQKGMMMAFGGIMLMYLVQLIASLFGHPMGFLYDNGPIGLVIALVITGVAALTLILDFDMIERGAQSGAPKYMEWYAGFSLMVTLVWLYIRILDLLSRFRKK